MRRIIAAVMIAFALPAAAADFPLTLVVLGTSETSREYKKLYPSPCITMALGAPCKSDDDIPGWAMDVLQVTGRVTQRGRTVQYELVCKSSALRRPCAPMKYGEYPARWRGKRLEVFVTDGKGKGSVNRFEIRGERDVNR